MPFIKVLKKGRFPNWEGDAAYDFIEVDNMGNPLPFTEKKAGDGFREPDIRKGYQDPFNYHLWNDLRKRKKVK